MFNPISSLYTSVKRNETLEIPCSVKDIDYSKISSKLDANFCVDPIRMAADMPPVGEITKNGFEFKLNKLNLYMIIPKVSVIQTTDCFQISRNYDLKSRWMQYYWISIGLIVSVGFILAILDPRNEKDIAEIVIFCFFAFLFASMLVIFSVLRSRLWKRSLDIALDLLEYSGINANRLKALRSTTKQSAI